MELVSLENGQFAIYKLLGNFVFVEESGNKELHKNVKENVGFFRRKLLQTCRKIFSSPGSWVEVGV